MNTYTESDVIRFIDPVFRFCLHHLSNYHDAEDLASEIMMHVIDGFGRYEIKSLDSWVWRIVHNRYARLINKRKNSPTMVSDEILTTFTDHDTSIDDVILNDEYDTVFKSLHSLSADYRNIAVDYYISELTVREIALNYSITETTVKWRLNVSREKIKNRIGDYEMEKIYKRINWNTNTRNGSFDPGKYLNSQIHRAICEAAYEKPLTIEDISMKTGIPTLYIEDEMDKLLYADAIVKEGSKYVTNFIVLRLKDRQRMREYIKPLISDCADYYEELYKGQEDIDKLGYIITPETIRGLLWEARNSLGYTNGDYPKRQDGGYGWFIISEVPGEDESIDEYGSGCNSYPKNNQDILYYWIGKYFTSSMNNSCLNSISHADFDPNKLSESRLIECIKANLVVKDGDGYKLNFPCFTTETHKELFDKYKGDSDKLCNLLKQLIEKVHDAFVAFTPKHLENQINQYMSGELSSMNAYIIEELQSRGVLAIPEDNLIYNIYYIDRR